MQLDAKTMWTVGFIYTIILAILSFVISTATADTRAEMTAMEVVENSQDIEVLKSTVTRLDERTTNIQSDVTEIKQDVKSLISKN